MAFTAVLRRDIGRVRHKPDVVRLVALLAVDRRILQVRFVALRALWNFPVYVMTESAVKLAVFALAFDHCLGLALMAVKAIVFAHGRNSKRCVGVRMTSEAAGRFEMSFLCRQMAFVARRDRLLHVGGMARVAADAGNIPMSLAGRCYVIHPCGMALHALFFRILIFRLG